MSISIVGLLVDFGLVVLIWMIQLIIYPSFLYYSAENLVNWHRKYTVLVGYVVAPLMCVQLGIAIYQIASSIDVYHVTGLFIISVIWIVTFQQFVPIHTNISKGSVHEKMLVSLVKKNWTRTVLWTLICILNMYRFF